jgi:cytochrome c-type biogenesis protein CcmF
MRNFYAIVCFTLCLFVTVTIVIEFYKGASIRSRNSGENFALALMNLTLKNKRRYGGYIVHFAVVLMFVGLAGNAFNREMTQQMVAGDEMRIGSYSLKMVDYKEGETANYQYGAVTLQAFRNGELVRTMNPQKRVYNTGEGQSTTEVALYSTPREDLYVVYAGPSNDGTRHEITAHVNPLVWWVWAGAGLMVLGTLVTLLPDRKSGSSTMPLALGEAATLESAGKAR